jgi:rod shape-determining protein MreC
MKYLKPIIIGIICIGGIWGLISSGLLIGLFRYIPRLQSQSITPTELSSEQLQAEVISLQSEIASLMYLKSENELLKSAIITKNETTITPVAAQVIFFDNDFTRSSAIVNMGGDAGVKIGQPVIVLGHIVGVVQEVTPTTSTIQFLNDSESKLAVTVQRDTPIQGILKSRFGTSLEVDLISKLEPIQTGQTIVTTPTDMIPGGIRVGSIKEVKEGELFHSIIVDYPISFYGLTQVFILKT